MYEEPIRAEDFLFEFFFLSFLKRERGGEGKVLSPSSVAAGFFHLSV